MLRRSRTHWRIGSSLFVLTTLVFLLVVLSAAPELASAVVSGDFRLKDEIVTSTSHPLSIVLGQMQQDSAGKNLYVGFYGLAGECVYRNFSITEYQTEADMRSNLNPVASAGFKNVVWLLRNDGTAVDFPFGAGPSVSPAQHFALQVEPDTDFTKFRAGRWYAINVPDCGDQSRTLTLFGRGSQVFWIASDNKYQSLNNLDHPYDTADNPPSPSASPSPPATNPHFYINRIYKLTDSQGTWIYVKWTLLSKWTTEITAVAPSLNNNLPDNTIPSGSLGLNLDQGGYMWKPVGGVCNSAGPGINDYTSGQQYVTRFANISGVPASDITAEMPIRFTMFMRISPDSSPCNMERQKAFPDSTNLRLESTAGTSPLKTPCQTFSSSPPGSFSAQPPYYNQNGLVIPIKNTSGSGQTVWVFDITAYDDLCNSRNTSFATQFIGMEDNTSFELYANPEGVYHLRKSDGSEIVSVDRRDFPHSSVSFRFFNGSITTGARSDSWRISTAPPTPTCGSFSITTQPQSQTAFIQGSHEPNQTANLSVTVGGTGPFTYQWYTGDAGNVSNPIPGANSPTHSFTSTSFARKNYWVRVRDACGSQVDSSHATVVFTDTRPLIFVPGIAGSVLSEGAQEIWTGPGTNILTCTVSNPFANLTLDPSQTRHSIVASDVLRHAFPGPVTQTDIYQTFLSNLESGGDYRAGETLFVFPYDWRKTNTLAAEGLATKIRDVRTLFPGMSVDILAHSMGGVVTQRYVMDNHDSHHVNKIITIGTPYLGAPKALTVLETGQFISIWDKLVDVFACQKPIKTLSQWFVGTHELIPSRKYYELASLKPFREDGWDIDRDGNSFETYNYSNLVTMLDTRFAPSTPGLNGFIFHNLVGQDDGSVAPGNISYYHIYGQQKKDDTIGQVIAKKDCLLNGHVCLAKEYLLLKPTSGDGTVPTVSATREGQNLNEPLHQLIPVVATDSSQDEAVGHLKLINHDSVLQTVRSILDSAGLPTEPLRQISSTPVQSEPAHYLRIIGASSLAINDSAANSTQITNASAGNGVPGVTPYFLGDDAFMLVLATNTSFDVRFVSSPGPISIEATRGSSALTTEATRYSDLLLPAGVTARLRFTPEGVVSLAYDNDGNGSFETFVTPTTSATGAAAQDTEPPVVNVVENRQSQNVTLVSLNAVDSASGIKKINYSLDGITYQAYSGPFSVDPYRVRKVYAFADDNLANRSGILEFELTATPPVIMVVQGTTNRAVALDSVTFVSAPFPVLTNNNFSVDRHTRLILFISGLVLTQTDASIVSVSASAFTLPVEAVGTVTGVPDLSASYVVVKLPDGLPAGELPLSIAVGGVMNSNLATLQISH